MSCGNKSSKILQFGALFMATMSLAFRPGLDALAKNPDYTPDTTDPTSWATYCVAVVRVESVETNDRNRDNFGLKVVRMISEGASGPPQKVPANAFWFGLQRSDWPTITPGDVLLMFYDHSNPRHMVIAEKIEGDHTRDPRVAALVRVAAIRSAGEPFATLQEGALDGDKTVAAYCLKCLLAKYSRQVPAKFVPRLRKHASDEAIDPKVRLLSIHLATDVAAKGDAAIAAEEERRWLCASIKGAKSCESAQLFPLARRLWEFPQHRQDNVEFLTELVTDRRLRTAVRAAAADTLPYEPAFHFTSPDALSDRIHRALLSMLDDNDNHLRALGSGHLKRICYQSSHRDLCREYIAASRSAIEKRLGLEPDEITRFHLKTDVERIDDIMNQAP